MVHPGGTKDKGRGPRRSCWSGWGLLWTGVVRNGWDLRLKLSRTMWEDTLEGRDRSLAMVLPNHCPGANSAYPPQLSSYLWSRHCQHNIRAGQSWGKQMGTHWPQGHFFLKQRWGPLLLGDPKVSPPNVASLEGKKWCLKSCFEWWAVIDCRLLVSRVLHPKALPALPSDRGSSFCPPTLPIRVVQYFQGVLSSQPQNNKTFEEYSHFKRKTHWVQIPTEAKY